MVIGVLPRATIERRHLGRYCSETVTADSGKAGRFIVYTNGGRIARHRQIVTGSVVFPVRTFYIEQMFVSVRMQFHNHGDCRHTTSETFRQGCAMYIRYQIWNVVSAQD